MRCPFTFIVTELVLFLATFQPMASAQDKKDSEGDKPLSYWIGQLKDSSAQKRVTAAQMIGTMLAATPLRDRVFGESRIPVLKALLAVVKDKDEEVRSAAIKSLIHLPGQAEAVPVLASAFKDESPSVRLDAGLALLRYLMTVPADAKKPAKKYYVEAMKDPVAPVRAYAASGLGSFPDDAKELTPILMEALKDTSAHVRSDAVRSLARMGPAAKEAVPAIIELLKRPAKKKPNRDPYEDEVRRNAAQALGILTRGTDLAVMALCDAFSDTGLGVSVYAVMALGDIGPAAKGAIDPLRRLLENNKEAPTGIYAAASLARIDSSYTKSSVGFLVTALKNKQNSVRDIAVDALKDIGPPAKDAVPGLMGLLKDQDEDLASRAAAALRIIDPKAAEKAGIK